VAANEKTERVPRSAKDGRNRWCYLKNVNHEFRRIFSAGSRVCGGEIILKGTRVTLRTILASLADGSSFEQILEDFPSLTEYHLRAVVAFAAVSAKEDLPTQVLPFAG
jgi:uncharacterized protein (DUF433 family)